MTEEEKARIILNNLEKYLQVNWAFEKYYIKGIKNGLREIKEKEEKIETTRKENQKRS